MAAAQPAQRISHVKLSTAKHAAPACSGVPVCATCTAKHVHLRACVRAHLHVCAYARTHACLRARVSVRGHARGCACACECVRVRP